MEEIVARLARAKVGAGQRPAYRHASPQVWQPAWQHAACGQSFGLCTAGRSPQRNRNPCSRETLAPVFAAPLWECAKGSALSSL